MISTSGSTADGIKEMEPHHPGRILQVLAHLGNIQRGCVCQEQALRLAGCFQFAENFCLMPISSENRFDNEITILERLIGQGAGNKIFAYPLGIRCGQFAFSRFGKLFPVASRVFINKFLFDVFHDNGHR